MDPTDSTTLPTTLPPAITQALYEKGHVFDAAELDREVSSVLASVPAGHGTAHVNLAFEDNVAGAYLIVAKRLDSGWGASALFGAEYNLETHQPAARVVLALSQ